MRYLSLTLCVILLLTSMFFGAPTRAAVINTIRLSANPSAIYADGRSICSVSAEVRDSSGSLVADGVQVRFSTSLGVIDTSATTVAGVARAMLRSGVQPGQAMVSAVLIDGQAVAQVQVQFLTPGSRMDTDACLTISSDRYLAYASDTQIVDASGGARARHRGLTVEADDIQVDVRRNILKARGKVGGARVTRGNNTIAASLLSYDLTTLQGTMIAEDAEGNLAKLKLNAIDLTTSPVDQTGNSSSFDFADLSATPILVKAKSITIRPRHDVQFKKAELYMDGGKTFRLPLYLIPLTAIGPGAGFQYINMTSQGVKVDIPLYYSLSPTGTGAVRLRNQTGGWSSYSSLPGWGLDLEQSYATGSAEGKFTVGQVTRGDWGIDWRHRQEFSPGSTMHTYVGFPAHRDLFGMLSYNKALPSSSFGLNLRGSKNHSVPSTMAADFYWQTNPSPFADRLNYSLTLRSSLANHYVSRIKPDGKPEYRQTPMEFGSGLQLQLTSMPFQLGKTGSLNTSLLLGHDWGRTGSGFSAYGSAMLTKSFNPRGMMALGYSYMLDPRFTSDYGRHRLSLNYGYDDGRWSGALAAVHTLDFIGTSAYADLGYRFSNLWEINARGTQHKYGPQAFYDVEFGLGYMLGAQEVILAWSRSMNRFRIEMGGLGF